MISVIIPTLNEEKHLSDLIRDLQKSDLVDEIIVADGGSMDKTVEAAKKMNVKVVTSDKGRAKQMNKGASVAKNEILFFLHADSRIVSDYLNDIPNALQTAQAGSYYLTFDRKSWMLNFYSRISRLNISLFTYGDQGLFLTRRMFEEVGGFKELPIMEDLEMIRRIKRNGRFVKLDLPIVSSSRRFVKNGIIRQQLLNTILVFLFSIGVKPRILARFYSY